MTLHRHDRLTVPVNVANCVPSVGPEQGDLGGYLLAWLVSLVFCSGLFGLAVLPWRVPGPRWLLLYFGAGCGLLTLLAMLWSRPWRQRPDLTASSAGNRRHHSLPGRSAGSNLKYCSSVAANRSKDGHRIPAASTIFQ
jgi:hypothetical protein